MVGNVESADQVVDLARDDDEPVGERVAAAFTELARAI
jgi:hypothetical protein